MPMGRNENEPNISCLEQEIIRIDLKIVNLEKRRKQLLEIIEKERRRIS